MVGNGNADQIYRKVGYLSFWVCPTHARRGFTLIEVVTSLAIMSVLMLGLSGAVMLGAHAIPTLSDTGIADQVVINVTNQLRSDLRESASIQYRTSSGDSEIRLVFKSAGAKGAPSLVTYRYTASADTLSRKVDVLGEVIVLSNVSAFAVNVRQDGSDANVMYFLFYVNDTIQRFYEIHAVLPDKPEVL